MNFYIMKLHREWTFLMFYMLYPWILSVQDEVEKKMDSNMCVWNPDASLSFGSYEHLIFEAKLQ